MNLYQAAFLSSPSPLAFLGIPGGEFLEVNQAFERLLGKKAPMLRRSTIVEAGFVSEAAWREMIGALGSGQWVEAPGGMVPPAVGGLQVQGIHGVETGEKPLALGVFVPTGPGHLGRGRHLQEMEEQYRTIFHQAVELLAVLDIDGRVLSANQTALNYHSPPISLEEVDGEFFWNTPWWADNDALREEVRGHVRAAVAGGSVRFQSVQMRPDGTKALLDNSIAPVTDKSGTPQYLVVRGRDITEIIQVRQVLAEAEERAQVLAEYAFESLLFLDPESGRILDVNTRAEEMLGYPRQEQVGKPVFDFLAPELRAMVREKVSTANGEPYEVDLQRKDGSRISVEVLGRNIFLRGRPVRVSAVRDLTWRKEAERRVRESEERYEALVAHIPDVTWVVSRGGDLEFISPNLERVLGYPADPLPGGRPDGWVRLVHPDDLPALRQGWDQLFKNGRPFNAEFRIRHKEGNWVWVNSRAIDTIERDGVRYTYGVFSDITEKRALEDQLRQAQKLEELGTLASGIAHDFNNLLVPIMGYGDLLEEGMPQDDPLMREMQGHLLSSSKRARDLVSQILTFSRKSEANFKVINAAEPVRSALRLLKASLPRRIHLREEVDLDGARILADETQVQQVAMNLCTNAVHAMGEAGGELTVSLEVIETSPSQDQSRPVVAGTKFISLNVRDTGSGIPEEDLPRIFDPFFTTKVVGKGTGLGLSMVHGIVRNHGGFIEVDSVRGQGTSFRVHFPLAVEEKGSEGNGILDTPGGSERVLLVDDNSASRVTAANLLKRMGYWVTAVDRPYRGLTLFKAKPERFDLALVDYDMPEMTGTHLAIRLLAERPDFPIVLMTGTDPARIGDVERLGVRGRILKPYTAKELGTVIRQALGS